MIYLTDLPALLGKGTSLHVCWRCYFSLLAKLLLPLRLWRAPKHFCERIGYEIPPNGRT